ncbi:MAG TPA: hypothetical protein VKG43_12495 [Acidimicrobiales bacterium]|nr:hypothetical protein [Acidimicrobiales bacterium]
MIGVALAFAAGCSSSPSSTSDSSSTSFDQMSAASVLQTSVTAADTAGTVAFVDVTRGAGVTRNLAGAVSAPAAEQEVGPTDPLQVILNNATIYVKATATTLESSLQLSAAQATANAGKWISLQESDGPYNQLAAALTISSVLDAYVPTGRLRLGPVTTVHGHQVVPVIGAASTSATNGASGTATLFVSTTARHTPVAGSLIVNRGETSFTEEAIFRNWGAPVSTVAPSNAIAYSSFFD